MNYYCNNGISYIEPGSIAKTYQGGATEPVTLAEAKRYMRIGFTDDDDDIEDMISAAREWCELKTGLSFIPAQISCVVVLYPNQSIELPYGPVTILPTEVDEQYLSGGPFPRITGPIGSSAVSYSTGYTDLPKMLKMAVKAKTAAMYENRGDKEDNSHYSEVALEYLKPFKRISQWL